MVLRIIATTPNIDNNAVMTKKSFTSIRSEKELLYLKLLLIKCEKRQITLNFKL